LASIGRSDAPLARGRICTSPPRVAGSGGAAGRRGGGAAGRRAHRAVADKGDEAAGLQLRTERLRVLDCLDVPLLPSSRDVSD